MNSLRVPSAPGVHSGRRPAAAGDSRAEILVAARSLFAARGFRGTTTRQIAQRAHVDVALIHHFFGTKAELFDAALRWPQLGEEIVSTMGARDDGLPERIARLYLDRLFVEDLETFSAVLRTGVGDPEDVPALRAKMHAMLQRISSALATSEGGALGLEVIGAQMIGILVMRHLVAVEPMASASTDDLVRYLVPAFRAVLANIEQEPS
ncbi:MAG: TetR family transcriptional regulator [Chloroflexota bacterium]